MTDAEAREAVAAGYAEDERCQADIRAHGERALRFMTEQAPGESFSPDGRTTSIRRSITAFRTSSTDWVWLC